MWKKRLVLGLVSFGVLAIPWGNTFAENPHASAVSILAQLSQADVDDELALLGVWECRVTRPDSSSFYVYHQFFADGNFRDSSGSDIYAPATVSPAGNGYSSRNGLQGMWEKIGPNLFNAKLVEILNRNRNETLVLTGEPETIPLTGLRDVSAGRFFVDQVIYHDPDTDTLCSGNTTIPNTNPPVACPNGTTTTTTIAKRVVDNAPFTDNFISSAITSQCVRLETTFPITRP